MAQDALLKAIEEDARAQAERIIEESEEAARGIVKDAEDEVSGIRAERLAALAQRLERRKASLLNGARINTGALKLRARLDVIERVLALTEERARGTTREEYGTLLNRFYEELEKKWLEEAETEPPIVLVNPEDAGLLDGRGVEIKPDPGVSIGVVFTSRDGRKRYENTVSSRIRKARGEMVMEIDRLIFGGPPDG